MHYTHFSYAMVLSHWVFLARFRFCIYMDWYTLFLLLSFVLLGFTNNIFNEAYSPHNGHPRKNVIKCWCQIELTICIDSRLWMINHYLVKKAYLNWGNSLELLMTLSLFRHGCHLYKDHLCIWKYIIRNKRPALLIFYLLFFSSIFFYVLN